MAGGIVVLDEAHMIRSWNRWSENTWGVRAEEAMGTKFEALDIGLPVRKLRDAISDVELGRSEHVDKMLEGVDRRGRQILCRIRVSALTDDEGASHGLVLIFQDITDERAKEDASRYLGRIMSRALNEIYFLDPATLRFALVNDGAQQKLGYSAAQLQQMTLHEVLPQLSEEAVNALIAPLLNGTEKEIVFETVIRGQEREYPAELCMQYLGDEEPPIVVTVVHETSERQQAG
jgi:two-component system CheB/CheR fusion protein